MRTEREEDPVPHAWKGRTFYSREELAGMTPEQRQQVREAHRPLAYVREDELPAAVVETTRAEAVRELENALARGGQREAS